MTRKISLEKFAFTRIGMPCGKSSPFIDLTSEIITLAELFGVDPENLLVCPAIGDSMIDEGIKEGDLIFADNSLAAKVGDVVIAEIDGETAVKKIEKAPHLKLVSCNSQTEYKPIVPQYKFHVVGVVVGNFRFRKHFS